MDMLLIRSRFARTKVALAIGLALALGSAGADTPRSHVAAAQATTPVSPSANGPAFAATRPVSPWLARMREAQRAKHVVRDVPAGAIPVTNCDDSGSGSLRDVLENVAVDGDTIDLTQLACSTISLTTGALVVEQYDLTLQGPGMELLTLSGAGAHRVLEHGATGHLTIRDLRVSDGLNEDVDYAMGGCIYSEGYLTLDGVEVRDCINRSTSLSDTYAPLAEGGGAFSKLALEIVDSSIVYNTVADALDLPFAITFGGGVSAHSTISITGSYIAHNTSTRSAGGLAAGIGLTMRDTIVAANSALYVGGLTAVGEILIESSAIVDNTAAARYGGLVVGGLLNDHSVVRNSTISGNTGDRASGVLLGIGDVHLKNCTIAFNASIGPEGGAGLLTSTDPFELESTVLADNTTLLSNGETVPSDLDGTAVVNGSHDLIGASTLPVPADTISDDPHLLPLNDNGGPTPTHALASGSPAIDAGSNVDDVPYDQRGAGFPRVIGAAADIGALEFDDAIFANGFDG